MGSRRLVLVSLALAIALVAGLALLRRTGQTGAVAERIVVYCAAGLKAPMDAVIADYERYLADSGRRRVAVDVQYGGSGTLLSLLRVSKSGDLFIAGDESYIGAAREFGMVREALPIAVMTPVIALAPNRENRPGSLADLAGGEWRVGIGMPDGTAIGDAARRALRAIGRWEAFESIVTVTKPTVNDLAADVRIGSLDAGIVFDAVARQYGLEYVTDPALAEQTSRVVAGVLETSVRPAAALHFARFLGAPEKGLVRFREHHYAVADGDAWADMPQVTLFSGGINKRVMDATIAEFERREGIRVNTVFQGCGGLTAQMRAMAAPRPEHGFPDGYLACDVYYMEPVSDWFTNQATVSSTRMVMVVAKGNPKNIRTLADLAQPGLRIVLGHPTHCTIGALSDRLLKTTGLYEAVAPNIVERQPSSGMMVPPVLSGAADASIAYYTDTLPERERLTVVELDHEQARAVQPFGIGVHSRHRLLMERFYEHIGRARADYESLGFHWEFGGDPSRFDAVAPTGARPHRAREGNGE